MAQCKCCKREKELKMGYCYHCSEAESFIQEAIDKEIKNLTKEELTFKPN
jgi:hypothetical protein